MIIELVKSKNIICKTVHFKCNKQNKYNIYSKTLFIKFKISKKYNVFQLNSELIIHLIRIMTKVIS